MNAPQGNETKPTKYQQLLQWMHYIPGGALLFAVMPLMILGYFAWYHWGAEHLDKALYAVRLEDLTCTPQPTWIRSSDVKKEVYKNCGLDQLSLLDPQASATIARAFESHNWVARVQRVTKLSGGKVVVDVNYRRPVAMIRSDDPTAKGYYPVDEQAVILPTADFDPSQVMNYFVIQAEGATSVEGMAFTDMRIRHALELCRFLESKRVELRLAKIQVVREEQWVSANPWLLFVSTSDNRRIFWGHAPGVESPGELQAPAKLARLIQWRSDPNASIELDLTAPSSPEKRLSSTLVPQ